MKLSHNSGEVDEKRLDECRDHKNTYHHQLNYYRSLRHSLPSDHLLVTMDFSRIRLMINISDSNHNDNIYINDYVIILEYKDENNNMKRIDLNFLCDDPNTNNNDAYYVAHTWYYLYNHTNFIRPFSNIILFSDTGPHHFRTRHNQYLLHLLSEGYEKYMSHNMFCPGHGHSIADGHAAHIKRIIKYAFIGSEGERKKGIQIDGPTNAKEVKTLLNKV